MRDWLERLFFNEEFPCSVHLYWLDDPRQVCVAVWPVHQPVAEVRDFSYHEGSEQFRIEIETLINTREEYVVLAFIRPVINALKRRRAV